jgi:uncharacterized cupredoxin-like copper-binding protein
MSRHPSLRHAAGAAALATAALALAACGGSDSSAKSAATPAATATPAPAAASASPGAVAVTETEYALKPATTTAKAGKVTFDVKNAGAIPHEFVVLKTKKPAAGLLKGQEADEAGNVGEIGNIAPGQSKSVSLKLKPGHYSLICNLPGHYMPGGQAGMLADFTVQ